MSAKVPLTFKVYQGNRLVRTEKLAQDVIKVGKLSSAHLRIDDDSVARMHAYIQVSAANDVYISDLGSARGTLVNGERVNKAKIKTGDEIRLGNTKLVVEIGKAPAIVSAPPPKLSSPANLTGRSEAPALPGILTGTPELRSFRRRSSFVEKELSPSEVAEVERQDGSRSIEVVAQYADRKQKVHHYPSPRAGRVGKTTMLLGALGLVVAIAGAAAFGAQVYSVKRQEAHAKKVKSFIKERGLNAKFVPKIGSNLTFEILGGLGFLVGAYFVLWAFFRGRDERREPEFTIGEHPESTFNTPTATLPTEAAKFPILRSDGQRFVVSFTPRMQGYYEDGAAQQTSLEDLARSGGAQASPGVEGAYEYPLPASGHMALDLGESKFIIRSVNSARGLAAPSVPERAAAAATAPMFLSSLGAGAVAGVFVLLGMLTPTDADGLSPDSSRGKQRFRNLIRKDLEKAKKDDKKADRKQPKKKPKVDPNNKDKNNATQRDDRIKVKSSGKASPNPSQTPSSGRSAGIMGVLNKAGKLGGLFSRDSAELKEQEDTLANLTGITYDQSGGKFGMGGGRGGGLDGMGGISFGGWGDGSKGSGGGHPNGWGDGLDGGAYVPGGRKPRPVVAFTDRGSVADGIDAQTVRRIVRKYLARMQYCYTSLGLMRNPTLRGAVRVKFVINRVGRVSRAFNNGSTLPDPATVSCVVGVYRRMRFPKPGVPSVIVTYGVNFRPAGRR